MPKSNTRYISVVFTLIEESHSGYCSGAETDTEYTTYSIDSDEIPYGVDEDKDTVPEHIVRSIYKLRDVTKCTRGSGYCKTRPITYKILNIEIRNKYPGYQNKDKYSD